MSGHETPMSPDVMHKPDATKEVCLKITNQTLKMVRIWCADEVVLPLKPHFWAENNSWGPSEVMYEPRS